MLLVREWCSLIVSGMCSFSDERELVMELCDCLVHTDRLGT